MTQDQPMTVGGLRKPQSRRLWTAVWLLVLGPAALGWAGANEERRLDTPLKLLYRAQAPSETEAPSFMGRERALEALDRLRARPGRGRRGAAIEGPLSIRLPVLVKHSGDASRLEEAGFRVQGRVGSILTGSLEADRLVDLLNVPGVQFIQSSRRLRAQVAPVTGARSATLRAQSSLAALSSTGSGVLVAFIDTGVDVFHQDFQKADGTTRIKYLLDLSDPGDVDNDGDLDGVGPYGGTLYTEADINAALTGGPMPQKDTTGHGSHGLSIAAGDDLALPGVAPGADLIVVKATREDGSLGFWSVDVVNALAFVDGKAAELARPYVVNLSLGTLFSSHDGRSLEEQALDALVGPGVPGKVAVIAAGNASDNRGTRFKHFRGSSLVGIPVDHTLEVPAYTPLAGRGNDRVLLDLWYEGRDRHRVSVAGPGCAPVTAEFGTFSDVQTPCGDVFIANMGTADPSNGDAESIVLIDDWSGTAPAVGTWTVTVEAREVGESGAYHAWLAEESSLGNTQPYLTGSADNLFLVGKPGGAYNGITVGSFARHDGATRFRTSWTDVGGNPRTDASAVLENISDFSSPGKTRDGRIKPELTAPGERVLGAVSRDAYPGVAANSIYRFHPFAQVDALITENTANHAFGVLQGTSFSAPVVSGLAARILQTAPTLDAIQVRNILINSALADASTGAVPNDVWGFGKANLGVGDAPLPSNLRITTVELPGGVLGEQYNLVLTASGGTLPYTWQVTSGALPPGLALTASGFLTGKPTASGPFSFTVGVTDSSPPAQTDSRAYGLTVASVSPLQVVSHVFPVAKIGKPYEDTLEAKGGTPFYTWSLAAGDLPPGLTLFANGLIQGTPNTLGRFNFTVEVQDTTAAVALRSLRIKVSGERGEDWDPLGKSTPTVNQIAVDPNDPNRVFVSTRNIDAVFETTNAGDSWRATSINNNLNTYARQLRISPSSTPWALAPSPPNDIHPYVFDGSLGRWLARPVPDSGLVFVGAIDFDATDLAYVQESENQRFLRSADQGLSWQVLGSGCGSTSLSIFRPDPSRMYSTRCATEDGGVTWSDVSNLSGGGVDIRVSQENPFDLVKGGGATAWRSVDRGRNWTATALTGTICCLDRSPLEPSVAVAGTTQGLFKSSDGGQTWRQVPIKGTNPNITSVAIDPSNPDSLWAGTGEGVFRSTDGGLTWSLKNNGLIRRTLSAVALSRSSSADVLLIAAEGPYASRTSGNTWTLSGQGLGNLNLREALISPADPNLFFVVNDSGLFRSDNRGVTWFEPNQSFDDGFQFVAVDADPFDGNTLIASLSGTRGTYRSSDRGLTWALKDTGLPLLEPTDLAFARDLNGRVFQSFNARGVFRSENKGDTWVQDGLDGLTVNDVELAASDSRYLYARAGTQLYYRNPSVTDWTAAVTQPSRPVLSLAVDAVNALTAYAGVDHSGVAGETGGVYQTTDGGRNWARIPGILDTYDVVSVATHPTTSGTVYAATLNAGVFRSTDGGQTWAELANYGTVADLTNVLVEDPSNPLLLFAGTEGYGVQVSADKGRSFAPRVAGLTSFNINAIAFDPDTPSTVYAGSDAGVFKSTDSGTTWVATNLTTGEVSDIVTDNEGTGRRIWASVLGQGVAFSSNAGASFTVYSNGLDSLELTSLEIENTGTGRRIWASAKGGSGLAYSDDLGQTWKPAAGNGLTDRNVNDVTIDTGAGRRIWASTDNGVFFSDDAGLSWRDLSLGLPSQVPVTSVAIDPNTSEVLVSLFSEGEGGVYRGGNIQGVWQPFNEGLAELRVRRLTSDKSHVVDATTRGTTFYAATAGDGAYASEIQTPAGTPVQITTGSLPDGLVKTAYTTTTLGAQGGRPPFVWSLALGSLPPGLSLDPATGTIGGEPGQEGLFEFTVQAADQNARTDQKMLSIKVRHPDVPALSVNDVFVLEGNAGTTNATFTVSLSQASAQTVTVSYTTADGTAFSTSDYGALGASLSFTPGVTSQTATVTVNGDMLVEPDETFFLRLSNATSAVIADAEGLGTILDDDTPPTLSVSDVSVLEGDAGTVSAVFTVTLSRPVGVGVTVDFATADGTALAGSDYLAQSGTLTFLAGTTSQTVTVTVNGDTVVEPDETFFLNLTNPVNADIADGQGVGTILNDDGLPTLTIDDVTVTEGAPNAVFTVRLSPASTETVTVSYTTADGTAQAPGDYQATTGTLSFAPGERVRTIAVPLTDDEDDEATEAFSVDLNGATNAPVGDGHGVASVDDDDGRTVSVTNDPTIAEGAGTALFSVVLDRASVRTITVDYATEDLTTTAGSDYTPRSGTLTFPPGMTSASVAVVLSADTADEGVEALRLALSNPVNVSMASFGQIAWSQLQAAGVGPSPRYQTQGDYDVANDRLMMFGGGLTPGLGYSDEVWVLSGPSRGTPAWQQLVPAAGPSARTGSCFGYDAASNRLIVYGGVGGSGSQVNFNDAWVLTGANGLGGNAAWIPLPSGPGLRYAANCGYDSATNTLIVAGGYADSGGVKNDVWLLRDANGFGTPAWSLLTALVGGPRTYSVTAYDPSSNRLIVFGGNLPGLNNETWVLKNANGLGGAPAWVRLATGGALPPPRYLAYGAYDAVRNVLFVFGGADYTRPFADTWTLLDANGIGAPRWVQLTSPGGQPPPRYSGTTGFSGAALVISPGAGFPEGLTDSWVGWVGSGGVLTIVDDDPLPNLSINDVTVSESAGNAEFTLTLSPASGRAVNVAYATVDETARGGPDYVASSGVVSIPAGATSATISVPVNGEPFPESNETFRVDVSTPFATVVDGQGQATIMDDDPVVNGVPYISDLSATSALPGGPGFDLVVRGANFVAFSVVRWNGADRPTVFVSTRELRATISAADIAAASVARVTVFNDLPGGGSSEPAALPVTGSSTTISFTRSDLPAGNQPSFAATGDFNADGRADLAATNLGSGTVSVWLGSGDGTFGARSDYPTGSSYAIVAADFNKDGRLDLAVTNYNHATVSILLGNGDGTFGPKTDFATGPNPVSVVVGDVNGDGRVDLAVAKYPGSTIAILLGLGDGSFFTPAYEAVSGLNPMAVVTGDFDGDGRLDLAAALRTDGVSSFLGNGDGTFGPGRGAPTPIGATRFSLATATFDGDDILDLLIMENPFDRVFVDAGNGDGTFRSWSNTIGVGPDLVGVHAAELNADGRYDIVAVIRGSDTISVILNDGVLSSPGRTDFAVGDAPYSAVSADFNGDGKLDLAVPNQSSNNVSILLNAPPPTLSISDATVAEGNSATTPAVFTVTLSPPSTSTIVTVNYASADSTANVPGDYGSVSGTLTFPPGTTTQTISVAIVGDRDLEADETFLVDLSAAAGGTISRAQATGTIRDDDGVQISINDVTLTESDVGTVDAVFVVSLSQASTQTVTVNYATADGTATVPADYAAASGTLTFAPGETSQPVTVTVNADLLDEPGETFFVTLSGATNASILDSQGRGTITDNDPTPTLAVDDVTVAEGNAGLANAVFTVSLSAPSGRFVTVGYQTADGTASSGPPTLSNPAPIAIPDSGAANPYPSTVVTSLTGNVLKATVKLVGFSHGYPSDADVLLVGPGGQKVMLMSDVGGGNPGASGVSLTFDDAAGSPVPAASLPSGTYRPTDAETGDVLPGPAPPGPYGTQLSVLNGTPAAGTWSLYVFDDTKLDGGSISGGWSLTLTTAAGDYTATAGTLGFPPGTTTQTVSVPVIGDTTPEVNETLFLNLSGATNATIAGGQGLGTIVDDDPLLSIGDVTVTEGNAGTTNATFTVTLSAAAAQTVSVNYATADGTATAPGDYASASGTLTFAPGSTSQPITVGVVADTTFEPSETLLVNLSEAVGATISRSQGVGTILNDDAGAPSLSFSASVYSVSEAGVRAVVTVKRAGSATGTVGVGYATSNETATAGSDYTATSGTLTFGPGVSIQTFVVPIANDTISEGPETALLELSAPTGGAILGSPAAALLTITDDDAAGTLRFSASAYSKSEGGGSASITVTRSGGAASGVTVDFATSDGTASAGSDYAGSSGTLSFGASELTKTFAVSILEDSLGENNETLKLTLSNPTGRATLSAPSAAVLTILENESVLQFSAPTFKVTEGTAAATITVKRTGTLTGAVSVDYATSDGSGTTGSDYTQSSGTLSFASGVVARTFSVPITNDSVRENPETVLLALRNATGAGVALGPQNTAVLTIADDDSLLQFSAASYSVAESTALATITVKRTGSAAATVGVDFATSDGTAAAGSDYTTTTGTLTFGPGVVSRTFTIPITNDTTAEPNEALNLSLTSPTGGAELGSPNTAALTIKDNDPLLRFSAATYSVSESNAAATITVTRSTSAGTVTVDFATSDGSAAAPSDYTTAAGTLSFLPGVLSRTFTVPIANDALAEGNETVNLALLNPGGGAALGTPTTAVLTIVDNETLLRFSAATYNVSEGSPSATITVTRTGPTAPAVTVDFATTDGTAAAGSDYTTTTGTLTFGPGVVTRTFTIPIMNDAAAEPNETVNLTLGSPAGGAGLGSPNTAILTIVENEPRLQFSAASYAATEIGLKASVTVKRTGSTASAVGVTFATSDGTATAGSDYTGVTTTLSFPPGVVAKTVTIPIANDTIDDDSETLNLTLSNPTGGAGLGTPNAAVLTIADNDSGGAVSFGSASYSVSETGGTATITVKRTGGAASAATVDFATSDGTAAAPSDYTGGGGTLTFAAGETTKTFTIGLIDDGLLEGNETVNLTLSSPGGGATLGAQTTAVVYIVDDEAP